MRKTIGLFLFFVLSIIVAVFIGYVYYVYNEIKSETHYHAGMMVFINGERLDLSGDKYMMPTDLCSPSKGQTPKDRVHLHNNNMEVVHVHDDGVTWGHLFSNLGFNFGKNYFVNEKGNILKENNNKELIFILNGKEINNPHNIEIEKGDKLLMSFGSQDNKSLIEKYNNKFSELNHQKLESNHSCSAYQGFLSDFVRNIINNDSNKHKHKHTIDKDNSNKLNKNNGNSGNHKGHSH